MVSITGLEMPNAWRTGQTNDSNFDISANQLNLTANREMWVVPALTIDWQTVLHTNAQDPVSAQDLATKNYVDLNGANLWSTFAAVQTVDMDSNLISNLLDPVAPQDAATMAYVDANAGASNLDELTDVDIIGTPANLEVIQFNGTSGFWENTVLNVPAGSAITQDDSSVSVIDAGSDGRVETVIDNNLKLNITNSLYDIQVPINMNSQVINSLGTPSLATDAATKGYVDTEIGNLVIPTDLTSLTDVTITTPAVNQVLVNNGAGQWVNQALAKAQLPSTIAYEDEINTFTSLNTFSSGLSLGSAQILDMNGSNMVDLAYQVFLTQGGIAPPDPALTDMTLYLADGTDFSANLAEPTLQVLIERDGAIEKKPIATSETIFALTEFTNGMFTEETGVRLITDGAIGIRLQQFNENTLNGGYEIVLDGQIRLIGDPDLSPSVGNTIDLTVGTDLAPTTHHIWTELVGGVPTMMSSTVEFPSTGDFALIAKVVLQSQAGVLADGAYSVNSPDNEIFDDASRGHLAHINDRLIFADSIWISGMVQTYLPAVGGGTLGNVTFSTTAGKAYELHLEDIEAFDITTGTAFVTNESGSAASSVIPVDDIGLDLVGMTCADNVTVIGNNDRVNVVVYSIHQDAEPNSTNYGVLLPQTTYASDADAINDISNFAIKTIPTDFRGVSLLVSEIVVKITNTASTFEVLATRDLRGQVSGSAGGGSSGGGGASQLNDLTDVTINTPLINQILEYDGAGQWLNVPNPAGLLAGNNIWTGYQDYAAIADPTASAAGTMRFFVETLDASNDALYVYLNQAGNMTKVRVA